MMVKRAECDDGCTCLRRRGEVFFFFFFFFFFGGRIKWEKLLNGARRGKFWSWGMWWSRVWEYFACLYSTRLEIYELSSYAITYFGLFENVKFMVFRARQAALRYICHGIYIYIQIFLHDIRCSDCFITRLTTSRLCAIKYNNTHICMHMYNMALWWSENSISHFRGKSHCI